MHDEQIVDLFWARSEAAVTETAMKYGRYCYTIAYNILHSCEDAEECVNDTYMKAWGAMPPERPRRFSAFIGRITRNLALNKYEKYAAQKRGMGQTALALSELEDCIPADNNVEQASDERALVAGIECFLRLQTKVKRNIFIRRYWYLATIREIAGDFEMSESKIASMLLRLRNQLKIYLEKEGIVI